MRLDRPLAGSNLVLFTGVVVGGDSIDLRAIPDVLRAKIAAVRGAGEGGGAVGSGNRRSFRAEIVRTSHRK